jgi:transposase
MVLIGHFEKIEGQRGIAWRCADSLALWDFLAIALTESTPVHASISVLRERLYVDVFNQIFVFVLSLLREHGLVCGKTLGVDATTLEANAAMKSIVGRVGGDGWKDYLRRLAAAEGIEDTTDDDLRRLDRNRKGKKVSNEDWESPSDPDSRITKMKDGCTHLAYKPERAPDLETEDIVAAEVKPADQGDTKSDPENLKAVDENLLASEYDAAVQACVTDKGYHDTAVIAELTRHGIQTFIPERPQRVRRWTDKPEARQMSFPGNSRRVSGPRGGRLSRWRSERRERIGRGGQAPPDALRSVQFGTAVAKGVWDGEVAGRRCGCGRIHWCFASHRHHGRYWNHRIYDLDCRICDVGPAICCGSVAIFGAYLLQFSKIRSFFDGFRHRMHAGNWDSSSRVLIPPWARAS